jgi:hypothetical protein
MMPHLLSSFDHTHPCPSLGTTLRTTTAIHRCLPDDLPSFDPLKIAWRCSPEGMALIQPSRFGESEHVLLVLDQHWQPLQDSKHAIAAALSEAELEYELLRPIESGVLLVQPRDAFLALQSGEECGLGSSSGHSYGAADIGQIRNALRRTTGRPAVPHQAEIGRLAGKPLTAEAQSRAREIVMAWDQHQAADAVALARSGLAIWRRMAVQAGCDPIRLERRIVRQTAAHNRRDAFPLIEALGSLQPAT